MDRDILVTPASPYQPLLMLENPSRATGIATFREKKKKIHHLLVTFVPCAITRLLIGAQGTVTSKAEHE